MARKKEKNTIITDIYSVISVERACLGELARAMNEVNARAINRGEEEWRPVGGPIIRDFARAEIMVVRRGELDLDE